MGVVLLVATWPVASAAAHATFVSMSPTDGSLVTTAPTEVVVTFNQPIQDIGTSFVVTAPSGASVTSGRPEVTDNTVTQPLVALTEQGTYQVAYRVTSTDGHPVSRGLSFALGSRTAGGVVATPQAAQSSGVSPALLGAAVAGLVVVVVVGFLAARRRSRPTGPGSVEDQPEDTW